MDFTAIEMFFEENDTVVYKTGISLEIPTGYVGLVFPRSSICKKRMILSNSVGVIDSGYRGEIVFKFKNLSGEDWPNSFLYSPGDRVGQIIIVPFPNIKLVESLDLSESDRGNGGFGSTGS